MVEFDTDGGARFIKADLHLHTPGSYDYQEDDIEPERLIDRFEQEGLEIAAVTDHNTCSYYEKLAEAAKDSSVTVLPGVEITTGQSGDQQIHMTAIFPPSKADRIKFVLDDIGIGDDPQNTIADKTIPAICDAIRQEDGLPILAHIDERAGALYEMSERANPTKTAAFEEADVAALEIVNIETEDEFPDRTLTRSSDAHHPDHLGSRFTFLKMNSPSFEGVRTALADPESRVSIEPQINDHASIDGLCVTDGFLQDRHLQFNKNLNCLIGGKGTGKSSVIEHIRFALDIDPRSDTIKKEYENLIDKTLQSSGEVQLLITGNNGDQYRITRSANTEPTIERLTISDGEETYKLVELPIDRFRTEFFDIEIHSQRELIELARNQTDQLDLLDTYFDLEEEMQSREEIKADIQNKSREILTLESEVDSLTEDKHRFKTLSEQVELMKQKGVDEYIEGQEDWEQERAELSNTIGEIETLQDQVSDLSLPEVIGSISTGEGPNEELLATVQETVEELKIDLEEHQAALVETVDDAHNDIDDLQAEWQENNDKREQEHAQLKGEIENEIDVDIDQFFAKQADLNELRGVIEELEDKQDELQSVRNEKEELFSQLQDAREKLSEARIAGISELNGKLNDVRVSLEPQANRQEYIDWINQVLQGSRVYTEDKKQIATAFDPKTLAEIIRDNDTERLKNEADISSVAAENFVEHDDLREQLIKLEVFELHDQPIIELNDGGWKRLDEMSDGQQCTALLSIAMIERYVPLVIDQPEDMLDNQFISTEVVDLVRNIKHDRQIITATHNANIPVLGDSEQIIVMKSNGRQGFYSACGSIDSDEIKDQTQDILEGGEEAFERRNDKYRQLG